MRKHLWVAGIAAAALIPSFAMAQTSCEQQLQNRRNTGTVVGGLAGAVVGNKVAGRGDRTAGTVIGAVVGAVAGNQIAKATGTDCERAYGFYDDQGRWHANAVTPTSAAGYYDRDGRWVSGAPQGYVANDGYWVATSNEGYYDAQGRWITNAEVGSYASGAVSGYYDRDGRWVAGPAMGRYDNRGRWMAGQASGRRDARGVWVADAQPGYYDANGRWRAGEVMGGYDSSGRWVPASMDMGGGRGPMWNGEPADTRGREAWLAERIRDEAARGTMSRSRSSRALATLRSIRAEDTSMRRRDGQLSRRGLAYIQDRLEALTSTLRLDDRRSPDRDRRGQ